MVAEFPCMGFQFLGMCSYNPAQPVNVYFDIGSGISALGFTLAIQQILKPIYQFRLRAYGVQFWHLTLAIFIGFLAVIVAALVPNLPISRNYFFGYPIFWELLGGLIIAGVYGFTAYLILRPTRIKNFNFITFVKSAGTLLSEASDDDRVKFASDLYHNIESLFKYAEAWDAAERHSVRIEFERLRSVGAEQVIHGRAPMSPFYLFTHRKALQKASYAGSLFRLMADTKFCATLVRECPWHTAAIVKKIGDKNLHVSQAEPFIQQLARQAIINDESMMAREIGYDGFGEAPLLSESLFSDPFVLKCYRPLYKLMFERKSADSIEYIARLNAASRMMLKTALTHHGYWGVEYMYDVESAYESVSHKLGWSKKDKHSEDEFPEVEWHGGIRSLYKIVSNSLDEMEIDRRKSLFVKNRDGYHNDLVNIISDIVYESLSSIANNFEGAGGRFWIHAIEVYTDIYPFYDSQPDGMNPLQQQLAIKLIDKLKENMQGWYPAISRVLLAVVGPYDKHSVEHRTAYIIFKDAVYKELQKLPDLYARKPDKIADYLPSNVIYDHTNNTLTHTYAGGDRRITDLSNLVIPDINLFDETNWR